MKHWLTRHLLSINENVVLDPTLVMGMKMLFDWANEAGLKGQRVGFLTVVEPRVDGPLVQRCTVWCKVECTEELEKENRALLEEQIKHAVLSGWQEEEDATTPE